jgi:hypothetical protein
MGPLAAHFHSLIPLQQQQQKKTWTKQQHYEVVSIFSLSLTSGPGRLKLSDSAPVLQYGTVSLYEFLAVILGIGTSLFLFNSQFYTLFTVSSFVS